MKTTTNKLESLAYNGNLIRTHKNQINGTDLWRAAGSPMRKNLGNWKKLEGTRDLTVQVAKEYKLQPFECFSTILEGEDKGVYLHPAIAIQYANYLGDGLYEYLQNQLRDYDFKPSKDKLKWAVLRDYHKIVFAELSGTMQDLGVSDYATPNRIIQQAISSIPKPLEAYNTDELERRTELEKYVNKHLQIYKPHGDAAVINCIASIVR